QYMSYVLNVMSRLKVTGKRMRAGRAQRVGRQGENGGMHNECYARGKYDTAILCAAQRKMHYLGDCPDLFWRILMNQFVSCLHLVRFFMLRAALRGGTGIAGACEAMAFARQAPRSAATPGDRWLMA